mmetsp:Transcript_10086/g.19735  ORF Transcript_10086/g.19735 Transcript_10086/m.19735 type:complete len:256 (-) Transcript_10086:354-1121(-)
METSSFGALKASILASSGFSSWMSTTLLVSSSGLSLVCSSAHSTSLLVSCELVFASASASFSVFFSVSFSVSFSASFSTSFSSLASAAASSAAASSSAAPSTTTSTSIPGRGDDSSSPPFSTLIAADSGIDDAAIADPPDWDVSSHGTDAVGPEADSDAGAEAGDLPRLRLVFVTLFASRVTTSAFENGTRAALRTLWGSSTHSGSRDRTRRKVLRWMSGGAVSAFRPRSVPWTRCGSCFACRRNACQQAAASLW